ncbi:MAG: NAD(P)/FAD-dependent oxidoreductase [Hyphomicrobiaceae bacterium]|jgi:sarcosine oxidase subunit beta
MASTSADVAIVGGGLMGCYSAYFLRRRGRSVVVIDKGVACAAASGVNFGNLRLQGRAPQEFPLSLRAQAIWEELACLTGENCGIVPCGHVYLGLAATDAPKLERAAHEARAAGLDVELLEGPAARCRWPFLSGIVTGASWSKRDAVADPAVASPAVARLAQRAGARLLERTEVSSVEPKGAGFILRTEQGHTVTCGQVVNAAGAWSGDIARHFGEPVPMFAAGPPLFTITPQNAYAGPSLHAVDGTLLLRPGRNGEAVAGSFPRVKADIATGAAVVPEDRVERGLARLAEIVPGLGRMRTGRVWSGVEGYLPDMLPVIGLSRTTPGLLHAFGFSGHGFQLAPGVGAVVADLIVDGASQTSIECFSIERFTDGVVADEKLWSEFDPELVATFRQTRQEAGNA